MLLANELILCYDSLKQGNLIVISHPAPGGSREVFYETDIHCIPVCIDPVFLLSC